MNELGTDWRDESTYEYTKVLSKHRWAWEFLRRNPSYRELWRDWNANYRRLAGELKAAIQRCRSDGGAVDYASLAEMTPVQSLFNRCHSFGLSWAVDPSESHPSAAFYVRVSVPQISVFGDVLTEDRLLGKDWPGCPNHLRLEFSLALPIESQLRAARAEIEEYRRRAQEEFGLKLITPPKGYKIRRSEFVRYLRLLDADLEGASLSDIGRVLFPTGDSKRSVSAATDTAQRMAREGYWVLLLQEEEQPYLGNGEDLGKK